MIACVRRRAWLALFIFAAVLAPLPACGGGGDGLSGNTRVISRIAWTAPETATYRILNEDGDAVGSGVLKIEEQSGSLALTQDFKASREEITDEVTATVERETLKPQTVSRVISGPEGERVCDARYEGAKVTVEQHSDEDQRTDELDVPPDAYDTWTDLFLWRTIDFREDFDATYHDILTCALVKPDLIQVTLEVKERQTVEVAAGTFEAWRLEIRSGGETTTAWYADDTRHTLVRYDNGQHVFELESIE